MSFLGKDDLVTLRKFAFFVSLGMWLCLCLYISSSLPAEVDPPLTSETWQVKGIF